MVREMSLEEFQNGRHGGHLGYQNGTIIAILNLYVARMPSVKFMLNQTYGQGPSWISARINFSKSESLCHSNASHQVSAQSDLWF